jgi:kynurenine formamidase
MNQTPNVIDLSLPITEAMRVYPGMTAPSINPLKQHETDGVQVSKLEIVVHAGTHVDAPRHFLADGSSIDRVALDKLTGEAVLIDLSGLAPGSVIKQRHLTAYESDIYRGDIVVLYTGYQRCPDVEKYCYLEADTARWLADEKGIKCLAGDIPSVDPVNREPLASSATHPSHHLLLKAGIPIVESLANLDRLPSGRFYFCCFPLNIVGSDGAPARAVAMIFD